MFLITEHHKFYLACQPVDFRKGIDGYAACCREHYALNPLSGHCFIFRNRRATAIKILLYDANGFWLCHKRLSKGRFKHWPQTASAIVLLDLKQLFLLLKQ